MAGQWPGRGARSSIRPSFAALEGRVVLEEILAAELLLGAAPEDPDLLALVALTYVFAGESSMSSTRLEQLCEMFQDDPCVLLEEQREGSLLSVHLRGWVAFQVGGRAYPTWRAAHQTPLRKTQISEVCARGSWFSGIHGEESRHPLESTVFSTLILQIFYCYC